MPFPLSRFFSIVLSIFFYRSFSRFSSIVPFLDFLLSFFSHDLSFSYCFVFSPQNSGKMRSIFVPLLPSNLFVVERRLSRVSTIRSSVLLHGHSLLSSHTSSFFSHFFFLLTLLLSFHFFFFCIFLSFPLSFSNIRSQKKCSVEPFRFHHLLSLIPDRARSNLLSSRRFPSLFLPTILFLRFRLPATTVVFPNHFSPRSIRLILARGD